MSVKSLLQLILIILMLMIIGGIYYLYFYSGSVKNQIINDINLNETKNIDKQDDILINENLSTEKNTSIGQGERSEDINIKNGDLKNKLNKLTENKTLNSENKKITDESTKNKIKNLTKEIEYTTTNKNGDIFKILAKYGKTNLKNNNILDLEIVNVRISSLERTTIYLYSDNASYNYENQNSKFYNNVKISYDDKVITCDNFDLNLSENFAKAYNNVVFKDNKSIMKSQSIIMDIITKDVKINSNEKINIISN